MSLLNNITGSIVSTPTKNTQFLPNNLPGLKLWLRSDQGITLSSGKVSAWSDYSSNANSCSQSVMANQPTYTASGGVNNRPYLTGGSTTVMTSTNNVVATGSDRTVWIVCTISNANDHSGIFQFKLAPPYCALYAEDSSAGVDYIYSDGVSVSVIKTNNPTSNGQTYLIEWDLSTSSNIAQFVNGVASTMTTPEMMTMDGNSSTGYQIMNTYVPFLGNIYEYIIIDHLASANERAMVKTYISNLYGLSIS